MAIIMTMNSRCIIHSCFLASLILLLSGCGGERLPPGMPKLYSATITVTQDGAPLVGAEVIILNVDPSVSWSAGGTTDENGTLKLRTMGRYNGAPAGRYKVAVRKVETPNIALPPLPTNPEQAKEYRRVMQEIEDNSYYLVDERFYIGRTELEVEITPSARQFTVDVSPAVRVKVPAQPSG